MITAVSIFRICNLLYQIVATFLVYGINLLPASYPALIREGLQCLLVFAALLIGLSQFKSYRKKRKLARISFIALGIISVLFSYFISHSSLSNIFIGIKYGFQWMFILLTSSLIGFIISDKLKQSKILKLLPRILVGVVLIGFTWQGFKLIWPDFFYSLGYGSLDDYAYGENPPIYYLTSYQGTLRRQGLFSGPNNYGYFLVAFLPLVRRFFTKNIKEKTETPIWLNIAALCIRFAGMFMTLSRAVLIGLAVVFMLMYRKQLKKNKKLLLRGGAGILLALVGLSVLKRESTLGHIASKVDVIPEIVSHPLGHGLGSSGPAIHYDGKFLPESYYFQIMLDIGSVGFLFRVIAIFFILRTQFNIMRDSESNMEDQPQRTVMHKMGIGLFALLIMGLFLHVFEDSMVNYLFFTIYGIVVGVLSNADNKNISKRRVFIVCGPSGVGKSTRIYNQINNTSLKCAHISRDRIRFSMLKEREEYFSHEDEVYDKFLSDARMAVNDMNNDIIFIDATHLTEKARIKVIKYIHIPNDAELYAVNFNISIETTLYQNELRKKSGRSYVSSDVIKEMYNQFVPANKAEKVLYKNIIDINESNRENIIL